MISPLFTLMKRYKGKKLYVWNVNRTSMIMFTQIAFMRINIEGFVTPEMKYEGETYMNRPIVTTEQIKKEKNCVVIVADEVSSETISMLPKEKVVYWSEVQEINEEIFHNKIIVYGIGYGAEKLSKLLAERGEEAELYCVTKRESATMYHGKQIIEASELEQYKDYSIIISVKSEEYRKQILDTLSGFQGQIYVEHIIDEVAFSHLNLFQTLDLAVKEKKEIYLYGDKNEISKLMEDVLAIYNIRNAGYLYSEDIVEKDIKSIFTIALDGTENKIVIICEILPQKLIMARKNIELAGFSLDAGNYVGFEWYMASDDNLQGNYRQMPDPLVGFSILYSSEKPGWKIYGTESKESIKIVVLGGSTSSEVYHPENWVSKLYYKLKRKDINVTIYNGAHTADDIVDEMLRFLRDGFVLQPQIVISMSGVNNLSYKDCENQFNETRMLSLICGKEHCSGVHSDESLYSFWNRNQKLMKLMVESCGSRFLGFLQPMNITMEDMDLREKSLYEFDSRIIGARSFIQMNDDKSEYINLMKLFEHQDGMYMDMAHYTDTAHEIIANRVLEEIIPIIGEIGKIR